MEGKKLAPKRRFNGFYKDWLELRLKDFREESDRYSYTGGPFGSDLKTTDYTKTGIRIIQLQNIGDGFFLNSYKIFTSEEKAESLSSNLIFPDDVIIAKMAEPLARAAIIPNYENKYLMASDGIRLKVDKNKFNNYFILTLINHDKFRMKALENSTGTTRKRIGLVTLGNLRSYVPEFGEQQKIGKFFKVLDEMIANQERKIAKVKALKSAYLTEMFPQEGETIPKRRFKGFEEEWNICKLDEIAPLRWGFAFPSSEFKEKGIPIIRISNILANGTIGGGHTYFTELENDENYILTEGSVLIAMSGATNGKVAKLNKIEGNKVYQNQRVGYFKMQKNIDYNFISILVRTRFFMRQLSTVLVAGAQPNISSSQIGLFEFRVPTNIKEQQKIGAFFKNLDEQIMTEEKKLEKLKKMKEAYLEEMFV